MYKKYKSGELLTGELKKMAIELLQKQVADFQESRAKVTDEILESFMKPRKLEWKGNPNPKPKEDKPAQEAKDAKESKELPIQTKPSA